MGLLNYWNKNQKNRDFFTKSKRNKIRTEISNSNSPSKSFNVIGTELFYLGNKNRKDPNFSVVSDAFCSRLSFHVCMQLASLIFPSISLREIKEIFFIQLKSSYILSSDTKKRAPQNTLIKTKLISRPS